MPLDFKNLSPDLIELFKLQEIFMPEYTRQRVRAYDKQGIDLSGPHGLRFAHYTSAENAISILKSKRIWMRNTTCMADVSEVRHGFGILKNYFSKERTDAFCTTFDKHVPTASGAAREAIDAFNKWWDLTTTENKIPINLYVTSLTEHYTPEEDRYGRLSMWRAFGGSPTRVAIVVRMPNFSKGAEALSLMFSPVAYLTESAVHGTIDEVIQNIEKEASFLQKFPKEKISAYLFFMLFAGVTCLKHEGFAEEQEWRAVYHAMFPSEFLKPEITVVGGVPQHVIPIPLDKAVSPKIADLDVCNVLDKIIIGPSPYPWVLYRAFVEILEKLGVEKPAEKVQTSSIPIRHGG